MITTAELAAMRTVQNGAMMDACTLRTWAPSIDGYGSEIEGWTLRTGVACGLDVTGGGQAERRRADGTIALVQATLRLALADGQALTAKDSIIVTHRNGELLTPALSYGIDGRVERGPTGVVVRLAEVT